MKKLVLSCSFLLLFLCFTACSSGNKFPDDAVIVLPDKQEIYVYMPREDVEAVLGKGEIDGPLNIYYDDLGLTLRYFNGELTYIRLDNDSSCKLKSGIESSYTKSDFIEADFLESKEQPHKYYSINDEKYEVLTKEPKISSYKDTHQFLLVYSYEDYSKESESDFGGHSLTVGDMACLIYGAASDLTR